MADDVLPTLSTGITTALREQPAISLVDKPFREEMADTVAHEAHTRAERTLADLTVDPIDPAEVDALVAKAPEIASQAEIGALIFADSDQIALDPRTRAQDGDPFLNAYHRWKTEGQPTPS